MPERVRKLCSVDGCERPYRAKGYCATHYGRWKYGYGDPDSLKVRGYRSQYREASNHLVQIRCPSEMVEQIDRSAERSGMNRSDFVKSCIWWVLDMLAQEQLNRETWAENYSKASKRDTVKSLGNNQDQDLSKPSTVIETYRAIDRFID